MDRIAGPKRRRGGDAGRVGFGLVLSGMIATTMGACAGHHANQSRSRDAEPAQKSPEPWPTQAAPVWAMASTDPDHAGPSAATHVDATMTASALDAAWGRIQASAEVDMVAGTVVAMTGRNVLDGDDLRLGVVPVTRANDPAAIGVIVAAGVSAFDRSLEGARASRGVGREGDIVIGPFAHEIATAGLARMWVVEDAKGGVARDLSPGDLLISADAPGCAMLDNASRFEVGYVVARVAESAPWGSANPADVGADGRRRMLVAVTLERFVRPSLAGLSRQEWLDLQKRELDRWRQDWERDANSRYRWDDMSRTWDEMDRFKKKWGNDWDDEQTWRDLRDSTRRIREQDDQLRRLRDDLDKSRRELEETRRGLDDLSRDVKGGRSDTGSRGGPDGGVKPAPR